MHYIKFFFLTFLILSCQEKKAPTLDVGQNLVIIEQDYAKALDLSAKEDKLLFIDFYTTWCGPCKKLDSLVFQNDTVRTTLAKDFVLLKYDAENDKTFHLSKKHHINFYPTALILNKDGYVVNRQYGFEGEGAQELKEAVFKYAEAAIQLDQKGKYLKGYSNKIDTTKYPRFYIDYVNREDTRIDSNPAFKAYWTTDRDLSIEENFSTLVYFANDAPTSTADQFLANKNKYIELYGNADVDTALLLFSMGLFQSAITSKNQKTLDKALAYAKEAMEEASAIKYSAFFQKQFDEITKQ